MNDPLTLTVTICKHRMVSHYLPKLLFCVEGMSDHFLWLKQEQQNSVGGIVLHVLEHVRRNALRLLDPSVSFDKGIEQFFPEHNFTANDLSEKAKNEFQHFKEAIESADMTSIDIHSLLHLVEHTGYHLGQIVQRCQSLTNRQFQFCQNGINEKALKEQIERDFETKWTGSAAVCINNGKILMVLQGKPEEEKRWSVPSGGKMANESYQECCKREVFEETGYVVEVKERVMVKDRVVHYFRVEIVGGEPTIQDPDQLIYEIAWKSVEDLIDLPFCFEEDRSFLIELMRSQLPPLTFHV